ncbi:MAG: 4-hydroxy-3-methylbut-2-enyl diphosphate reductase [Pseudomonadota bacterium]
MTPTAPGPQSSEQSNSTRSDLLIRLAAPRGFCAGVDRAIQIVEKALEKFGAPVYVRHEIVHNRFVVEDLQNKGARFVAELDEIPEADRDRPVIFSAHGVPKSVPADAKAREMFYLDATCPLVSKVHREAEIHHGAGRDIILIGHEGHPEVIGTMGQLPEGAITLIETADDVAGLTPADPENLAYITQTTLSIDDTADVISALQARFPSIAGPAKEDICYATTNRQTAVKEMAKGCDYVLVVGAPNSSNSNRLVEVAVRAGAKGSQLVQRATDIPWDEIADARVIGITAGASAPEVLVNEVVDALGERFSTSIEIIKTADERVAFNIPRALRDPAPASAPTAT